MPLLTAVDLPVELVLHIFEALCGSNKNEALNVATLSRLFQELAVKHIYTTVVLTDILRWEAFWGTISSDKRTVDRLETYVRNLAFAFSRIDADYEDAFLQDLMIRLPRLNLTNLYTSFAIFSDQIKAKDGRTIRLHSPRATAYPCAQEYDLHIDADQSLLTSVTHAFLAVGPTVGFPPPCGCYPHLMHVAFDIGCFMLFSGLGETIAFFPDHVIQVVLVIDINAEANRRLEDEAATGPKRTFGKQFVSLHRQHPRAGLAWNVQAPPSWTRSSHVYNWERDMRNGEDIWARSMRETAELMEYYERGESPQLSVLGRRRITQ